MPAHEASWSSMADVLTHAAAALDAYAALCAIPRAKRSGHQKTALAASRLHEVEPAMEQVVALLTDALPPSWGMSDWGVRLAPASGAMTWAAKNGKAQKGIRLPMSGKGLGEIFGAVAALCHLHRSTTLRSENEAWFAIAGRDHPGGVFLVGQEGGPLALSRGANPHDAFLRFHAEHLKPRARAQDVKGAFLEIFEGILAINRRPIVWFGGGALWPTIQAKIKGHDSIAHQAWGDPSQGAWRFTAVGAYTSSIEGHGRAASHGFDEKRAKASQDLVAATRAVGKLMRVAQGIGKTQRTPTPWLVAYPDQNGAWKQANVVDATCTASAILHAALPLMAKPLLRDRSTHAITEVDRWKAWPFESGGIEGDARPSL